jgi:hypothetical protein
MNITLLENDGDNDPIELGVLHNFTIIPRIKEKLSYKDKIYEVEDLIWHTDHNDICVTLWLDFLT